MFAQAASLFVCSVCQVRSAMKLLFPTAWDARAAGPFQRRLRGLLVLPHSDIWWQLDLDCKLQVPSSLHGSQCAFVQTCGSQQYMHVCIRLGARLSRVARCRTGESMSLASSTCTTAACWALWCCWTKRPVLLWRFWFARHWRALDISPNYSQRMERRNSSWSRSCAARLGGGMRLLDSPGGRRIGL